MWIAALLVAAPIFKDQNAFWHLLRRWEFFPVSVNHVLFRIVRSVHSKPSCKSSRKIMFWMSILVFIAFLYRFIFICILLVLIESVLSLTVWLINFMFIHENWFLRITVWFPLKIQKNFKNIFYFLRKTSSKAMTRMFFNKYWNINNTVLHSRT